MYKVDSTSGDRSVGMAEAGCLTQFRRAGSTTGGLEATLGSTTRSTIPEYRPMSPSQYSPWQAGKLLEANPFYQLEQLAQR